MPTLRIMRFQDGLFCVTLFTLIFLKMKCGAAYYRLAVNRCPPARGLSAGRCVWSQIAMFTACKQLWAPVPVHQVSEGMKGMAEKSNVFSSWKYASVFHYCSVRNLMEFYFKYIFPFQKSDLLQKLRNHSLQMLRSLDSLHWNYFALIINQLVPPPAVLFI